MRTITIRFWYKKAIVAKYIAYKLRYYKSSVDVYSEHVRPHTICPYAVFIPFNDKNIVDFEDIVSMVMDTAGVAEIAEVAEILIKDKWFKLTKQLQMTKDVLITGDQDERTI